MMNPLSQYPAPIPVSSSTLSAARKRSWRSVERAWSATGLLLVATLAAGVSGCGSNGYPGGGITGLNASAVTIDAGQSYKVTASVTSNPNVSWTLSGTTCSGSACGSVSGSTGLSTTYTAPAGTTTPILVTLTAGVSGTKSASSIAITVNPDPSINAAPPAGTVGVPYTTTLTGKPGTNPMTLSLESGTMPPGLTFTANGSTGVISGTPTVAGVYDVMAMLVDSSAMPFTATQEEQIVINSPAPVVLPLALMGNPPSGTVNTTYNTMLTASGGVAPYTFSLFSGGLPQGLTLSAAGAIAGTPTMQGMATFTAQVKDSAGTTAQGMFTINVVAAGTPLALSSPPNGQVSVPYNGAIGVSGGKGPYSCAILSGTLPAGLTANNCAITGTPTTPGTATLSVMATDSTSPTPETTTGPVTLTIAPAAATLNLSNPPAATVNVPYTGNIGVSGGTSPYTCQILSGTLQAGLSASNCTISGTPTVAGAVTLSVKATDSSNPMATTTGPVTVTVNPATGATLTLTPPATATVQTPYTGTIGVSGGTGPYICSIPAGTLPPGLTNNSCVITGTPTTAGTTTVTVTATDSSNPANTTTGPVPITVLPLSPVTLTGSLPNATLGVPYTQTLSAHGGLPPYTYTLTAGALPAGITLSSAGVISGTPTMVGASSFTVTATDSESTPQSASLPLVLLVVYPATANDGEFKGPYAFLFQGYDDTTLGVLAYQTATVGSFTADGAGGISAGELDANHQTSTATGNTVSSHSFVGTYTLGTDSRGMMTLTQLNANGTVGATNTYAIALKAPIAPATVSTQGDLIEYDSNQAAGTKGSGSLLAQTASSFSTGLTGTYAFGVSGDTPCAPSCTLNVGGLPVAVTGGPVAAVGELATSGGAITGQGDSNVGAVTSPSSVLTGTYGAADGNGRVQVSLATSGTQAVFPSDYAVYMVSASTAFVMSTDKHSAYDLLAGSVTQQTQASFGNAAMTGAFVGYENSATNPGLVGSTLQGVTNFSTAEVFEGTDTGNGTCTINRVDEGGVTALVDDLTGLAGTPTGLSGLLSAYAQTGATTCPVATNGRGTLQYPEPTVLGVPLFTAPAPRVFYLSSPNTGYFLETGYAAAGKMEAQTGAPFTMANTFTGTYVYGNAPASSAASVDSSGVIVSNGAGQATTTLDMNVGAGTVNVLQLGTTATYAYTAPDAYGRFTLGTTGLVLYAITPNRFVLLDTSALTTSPAVAVLF